MSEPIEQQLRAVKIALAAEQRKHAKSRRDVHRLTRERDGARRKALEEAATAAGLASWMHAGEDDYSRGMDAGARHQVQACVAAIRSLSPQGE